MILRNIFCREITRCLSENRRLEDIRPVKLLDWMTRQSVFKETSISVRLYCRFFFHLTSFLQLKQANKLLTNISVSEYALTDLSEIVCVCE